MADEQAMVEAFHRTFDIVVNPIPTVVDGRTMADLLYVIYGTAVSYGIDMDPVFREVHRSNMSKVGGYKREDGKWVKPATYSPARIELILAEQGPVQREVCSGS